MSELIAPNSLKDLVDAHAIHHATVVADKAAFKINVKYGMVERTVSVRTRDGQIKERVFTSLDAVARFMRDKIHLTQYDINAANFDPSAKAVKRPDTAKRLTAAHAALSHSEWAQQKVQAAREGMLNGTNKLIEPDEWTAIRQAKQRHRDTL
ncbi:hypothetical protein [Solimicrobium silvestre]|uniref:Uncharacterized protein n=1 Tax=Solimicrobium silvestre TaxID=2099400 RepID=A0A2S9H0C4_9BURK|nr:hypothetical protein [Solimicrobium silvestre]PRC93434.1 hypothetical protein S2091_1821 [Solimicrobium silvestre]